MPGLKFHTWFTNKKEFEIIKKYQMTNDRSIIADALRNLKKPSPVMKSAMAAIVDENEVIPHYKPVPRRKDEFIRNLGIAFKVHHYSKEIGRVTRNSGKIGPIEKVANEKFDRKFLSHATVKNINSQFSPVIDRLHLDSPEGCRELVDMITAAVKGFDEVILYKIMPFVNGESFDADVTKTEPPD